MNEKGMRNACEEDMDVKGEACACFEALCYDLLDGIT